MLLCQVSERMPLGDAVNNVASHSHKSITPHAAQAAAMVMARKTYYVMLRGPEKGLLTLLIGEGVWFMTTGQ
jgi:hypothetical protein